MKKIGIIGGMSMESTIHYLQKINMLINTNLGGFHSAKTILYNVDFAEIVDCQRNGDWQKSSEILNQAAISLQRAGADFIVMATNTMHKVSDAMLVNVDIPFLHIAHATLEKAKEDNVKKIGLLGTRFTMEEDFYKKIFVDNGIDVIIPNQNDITEIDRIIFEELCKGHIWPRSSHFYSLTIEEMKQQGAEAIIYGCTEIEMFGEEISSIPVYNTTQIHVEKAVQLALD